MSSSVLIVDDDLANRLTLEAILTVDGYQLEMASNAHQALQAIASNPPDVILLDVMMPGMDGVELCNVIRQNAATAEIPIVILTSLDDRETLLSAFSAGADDFITKPYDVLRLRARVSSITRINRYRLLVTERARLAKTLGELEVAIDATLMGWSRALELRDSSTSDHSQRVIETTLSIARRCGIDEGELVHIRRGALLHDIGKMGIPDAILLKPAKLTEEEMGVMRKHPELAMKFLEPIPYLKPALDIPYAHHERWDGTGYPRGLKGEQTPLAARIFAVVDVWDALTMDRPYRPAWTEQAALDYIRAQAGSQFDPRVVELFLELFENRSA